ncbi:hypothetical protein Pint_19002 [Pistacia integerrima]|uniref:Uncharacterized protein n=1 Tax=Pistacia integerrima TaxID=434235 RepID=A0ACC0YZA1_9ROSI|nr:hypothetical protein Pint_19002 [Pistacia integerrima]
MDSHSNSRLLFDYQKFVTGNTGNGNEHALSDCMRYRPYTTCLPGANKIKIPETCGQYKRKGCP